jgi:sRNA-binding regulator protein Hfq
MYRVKIVLKNGTELTCTAKRYDEDNETIVFIDEKETMTVFKSEISYLIITEA